MLHSPPFQGNFQSQDQFSELRADEEQTKYAPRRGGFRLRVLPQVLLQRGHPRHDGSGNARPRAAHRRRAASCRHTGPQHSRCGLRHRAVAQALRRGDSAGPLPGFGGQRISMLPIPLDQGLGGRLCAALRQRSGDLLRRPAIPRRRRGGAGHRQSGEAHQRRPLPIGLDARGLARKLRPQPDRSDRCICGPGSGIDAACAGASIIWVSAFGCART